MPPQNHNKPPRDCKYGLGCVRVSQLSLLRLPHTAQKNPAHFDEFAHPAGVGPASVQDANRLQSNEKLDDLQAVKQIDSQALVYTVPAASALNGDTDVDLSTASSLSAMNDSLALISGIAPKKVLADGEKVSVGNYTIKRTQDHYYCTCQGWRMNKRPVDARTCKHLKELLGDAYESARLLWKDPHGASTQAPAKRKVVETKKPSTSGDSSEDDHAAHSKKKPRKKRKGDNGENSAAADDNESSEDSDVADDAAAKFSAKNRAKREETKLKQPPLLLAHKYEPDSTDPTGWWISEKLDGVRAFWDCERSEFVSRLGNAFTAPDWFKDAMPKNISLDGELFGGRGMFSETVSVVKTINSPNWKKIQYQVFDSPSMSNLVFEDRLAKLLALYPSNSSDNSKSHVKIVEQERCKGRQHVLDKLKEVETTGGEGLMLREPQSLYVGKRSKTLLKVKSFYDAEAVVVGYEAGKGKHANVTGSLKCKMASGKEFKIGTGLSDAERQNPPKIGAIVTYRFQELTNDGVPRFPSYVGVRIDANKAKDAIIRSVNHKGAD
ncbi:hypothetical protein HDU84_001424 [Entophlyctis sp. JEL0112]|nr:hypothetical protein HDU84_001424 [Entophlyctis sp. JEL0112]